MLPQSTCTSRLCHEGIQCLKPCPQPAFLSWLNFRTLAPCSIALQLFLFLSNWLEAFTPSLYASRLLSGSCARPLPRAGIRGTIVLQKWRKEQRKKIVLLGPACAVVCRLCTMDVNMRSQCAHRAGQSRGRWAKEYLPRLSGSRSSVLPSKSRFLAPEAV
jgi:hypothetical protein